MWESAAYNESDPLILPPSHINCRLFERQILLWKRRLNYKRRPELERLGLKTLKFQFSRKDSQPSPMWVASKNCPGSVQKKPVHIPRSQSPPQFWAALALASSNTSRCHCRGEGGHPARGVALAKPIRPCLDPSRRWRLSRQGRCWKSAKISISDARTFTDRKRPRSKTLKTVFSAGCLSRLLYSLAWTFRLDWCQNRGFRVQLRPESTNSP